jgi:hypothetical protein
MQPKPHPRSTEQALRQQKADAERDRHRAAEKTAAPHVKQPSDNGGARAVSIAAGTAVPAVRKNTVVAVPDTRTAHERYLDEIAPTSIVGRMIKFSREGQFVTADDGESISESTEFIALVDQLLTGWVKFNGSGEPPIKIMGLHYNGFVMPPVEELPDRDPTEWELGLDNQPSDPWKHFQYLILQQADTADLFTFVTQSQTGRCAVGNLMRHYDRQQKTHPDTYPRVRLKPGGFVPKDPRKGTWVPVPTFVVVGRALKDSTVKPDTSLSGDLDDKIDF